MTDSLDDRLARRLASLESDIAGIALPGAGAARRRAAQRTRHQVTSGVLAGVAAVAVGVAAIGQPSFVASPEPIAPATDSPAPTPDVTTSPIPPTEPTPDPSEEQSPDGGGNTGNTGGDGLTVPPGALFELPDVVRDTEVDWVQIPAADSWLPCVPEFPQTAVGASFAVGNSRFDHIVEPTPAGTAQARLDELRDEITACAEGGAEYNLIQVWSLAGVGDGAYLMAWQGPPATVDTQTYVTGSLARSGDYISVIFSGGEGQDYNGIPGPDDAVRAIERLCAALGTECSTAPEQERLFPEPVGDVDGWLTIDDIAEAGLTRFTEGSAVFDPTEHGQRDWGFVAFAPDPFADGAESIERRGYADPLEVGGPAVDQARAHFPDEAAAHAHYDRLVTAADGFTQDGSVITNTGGVGGSGYDGTTWRMETPEHDAVFAYGVVVSGDIVSTVVYGLADQDLSLEQMRGMLARAGQRIGG